MVSILLCGRDFGALAARFDAGPSCAGRRGKVPAIECPELPSLTLLQLHLGPILKLIT